MAPTAKRRAQWKRNTYDIYSRVCDILNEEYVPIRCFIEFEARAGVSFPLDDVNAGHWGEEKCFSGFQDFWIWDIIRLFPEYSPTWVETGVGDKHRHDDEDPFWLSYLNTKQYIPDEMFENLRNACIKPEYIKPKKSNTNSGNCGNGK